MPKPVRIKRPLHMGRLSAADLLGIAEKRGLKIRRETFERITGKTVFQMKMQGEIISLWEVAAGLGRVKDIFYGKIDVKKLRIGQEVFVTPKEAERIKSEYLKETQRKMQIAKTQKKLRKAKQQKLRKTQRQEKLKKTQQKKVTKKKKKKKPPAEKKVVKKATVLKQKTVVSRAKSKEVTKKPIEKAGGAAANPETMKLINGWKETISGIYISDWKERRMLGLLSKNAHLTPDEFRVKVAPKLIGLMNS